MVDMAVFEKNKEDGLGIGKKKDIICPWDTQMKIGGGKIVETGTGLIY